jgi:hypothetical protein
VPVRRRVVGEAVIREASARDCDEVAGRDVHRELEEDRILGGAVDTKLAGGGVDYEAELSPLGGRASD